MSPLNQNQQRSSSIAILIFVILSHNVFAGNVLNIAVIGAGTAGLCAAKHVLQHGFNVTVYEQTDAIGGVWSYTEKTGKDQYGVNIHTALYQGLRANLPNQLMAFPDHEYPANTIPYPPSEDVLKFLYSYVDRFELEKVIKLNHLTIRVQPIENEKWEVIIKDLPNNRFETNIYDAVIVCNGHHYTPRIPKIAGVELFNGQILHSHDYRKPNTFQDKSVLVIGGGPSGMDIVAGISNYAKRVTFSQHKRINETTEAFQKRKSMAPPNVTLKDNVQHFTATGAEFIDGTHQTFSVIFFATGYNFAYSFLSVDTGINVDDNFVQPLYKQIINIKHPSMAFIGIPFYVPTTQMFDLQVRFALKFLAGEKQLPSEDEMLTDMLAQTQLHWQKGYKKHQTHYLGPEQKGYYKQLADTANITNLPDVLADIHFDSRATMAREPSQFRKYRYTIVDDQTFTKEKYEI